MLLRRPVLPVMLVCSLLLASPVLAAPLELGELQGLIQSAEANNPELVAARASLAAAQARAAYAGSLEPPKLGVGVMNAPSLEGLSAGVSQMIPAPGKLGLAQQAAEQESGAAAAAYEARRLAIGSELADEYYTYSALMRMVAVHHRVHAQLGALVRVANAKYAVGKGVQQDSVRAQLEIARILKSLAAIEERMETARARINKLANRPLDSSVRGLAQLPSAGAAPSETALVAELKAHSPELRELAARTEAARLEQSIAEREAQWPDFDLGLQAGRSMPGNMPYVGGMVGIDLPWLAAGRLSRRVEAARQAEAESEAAYQARLSDLTLALRERLNKLSRIDEQLKVYRQALAPLSVQGLKTSLAAYQVGQLDFESVIMSQNAIFETEMDQAELLGERSGVLAELRAEVGLEPVEVRKP